MPAANPEDQIQQDQPQAAQPKPTATPAMSAQWKCEMKGVGTDGKSQAELPEKITVGQKLMLICDGPAAPLVKTGLVIEPYEAQKYSLHLLEVVELGSTKATLIVTPWQAGEWKVQNPALTDHHARVGLGDFNFNVASVIDPSKNPEGKPYPPTPPLSLAWPLWLWILLSALACGVLYIVGLGVRKSMRRKNLIALLEKNATALSPVNHFNKELRKLQRQVPLSGTNWDKSELQSFFTELESQFRWFLARELVIPAIDGSPRTILKSMKKVDLEVYQHSARDVRVALLELRKAKTAVSGSSDDALQLIELTRKVADRIAKERNV